MRTEMRIVNLIENTEGSAGCAFAHGLSFYTCHCTGEPAYKMMKLSMGEQLQYVHSGDEVTIVNR